MFFHFHSVPPLEIEYTKQLNTRIYNEVISKPEGEPKCLRLGIWIECIWIWISGSVISPHHEFIKFFLICEERHLSSIVFWTLMHTFGPVTCSYIKHDPRFFSPESKWFYKCNVYLLWMLSYQCRILWHLLQSSSSESREPISIFPETFQRISFQLNIKDIYISNNV